MKKRKLFAVLTAVILLLSAGCGGSVSNSTAAVSGEAAASGGVYYEPDMELPMSQETSSRSESPVYQNAGAKLIRRAELSIQTTEFDQAVEALDELVTACGGYYENASVYAGSYRNTSASRSGEYVVRVPAEQFRAFLSSAGSLGYVTSSTESSEDVGEQYYDTEARLKTQRTKQERLLGLLEQAATMEDIISLENALSDVEYEIEQLSSTLNHYDALIGYSTVRIYLNEVVKVTEEVGKTATLGQRMAAGFAASAEGLAQGFQDLLVWFSYHIFGILIFAVVVAAVAAVVLWKVRPRAKKKAVSEEHKED